MEAIIKIKEFRTKRLILRPIKLSDFKVWQDAFTSGLPAQSKWDLAPLDKKNCTLSKFKKGLGKNKKLAKTDEIYYYEIFEKKTGAMIGYIDFNILGRSCWQFANFGYQIFNRHWGNGYGAEAAKAGLKIGFTQLKLNRIEASIDFENKKSLHLTKKIGMKFECIRKRYRYKNGKWNDRHIYVVNPEDIGLRGGNPGIF